MNIRLILTGLTLAIILAACTESTSSTSPTSAATGQSLTTMGNQGSSETLPVHIVTSRSSGPVISDAQIALIENARFVAHTFSNGETVDWENRSGYIVRDGDVLVMKSSELRSRLVEYEQQLLKNGSGKLATQSLVVVPTTVCSFYCTNRDVRWKSLGMIPYSFDPSLPFSRVAAITSAIDDWNNTSVGFGTPIKWQQVYNAPDRVQFTAETDAGACGSSFIGKQGGVQLLKVGDGACLGTGIIQHEMLHAVGTEHEQQRCDRDNFILVVADQYIKPERRSQFAKLCDVAHQTKSNFDYDSLMLYGPTGIYHVDGTTAVISVPQNAPAGSDGVPSHFGHRNSMSFDDISGLRQNYRN